MKSVLNKVVKLSLVLLSLLFIGGLIGNSHLVESSQAVPESTKAALDLIQAPASVGLNSTGQASVTNAGISVRYDGSNSILDLLVNDEALERLQTPLADIWQSYLTSFEENNKSPERLEEEAAQRDLLELRDEGQAIEGEFRNLAPILPADYTGHYLGREKFTIVLSSFDNLDFYKSLFTDLSLVEFKLADHSYLELFAIAEELNKTLPLSGAIANVNSVLGRITISVYSESDQDVSLEPIYNSINALGLDNTIIDIEIVEPIEILIP